MINGRQPAILTLLSMRAFSVFTAGVAGVLLLAAVLRLWGIAHTINTDENKVVVPSVRLARGQQEPLLYPKGSYYPHLYHYILGASFLPITFTNPSAEFDNYYTNIFLLTARVIAAAIGVLTVAATIAVGTKLHCRAMGILAGAIMAVIPLHVKYSHYSHVDIPLTLLITLTLYAAVRTWQTSRARWYVLTGILVGLSTATLYTGIIAGILLPLAHLPYVLKNHWSLRSIFARPFVLALIVIPLTFVAVSPYSVLRYHEVWQTYNAISDRAAAGDLGYTRPHLLWPLWNDSYDWGIPFTSASLIREVGVMPMILAVIGLGVAFYRRNWQIAAMIGGTMVVLYLVISGQVRMSAVKRFLPLVPLLALLAAYAVRSVFDLPFSKTLRWAGMIILLAAIVIPASHHAAGFNAAYAGGSTHQVAVAWAYEHLDPGTALLQHTPLTFIPPDDPGFRVVRLNEVYANRSVSNSEVALDRAKPITDWIKEAGIQVVVLDSRMVDRYYDATSRRLFPETTASYQAFYDNIRQSGKLLYQIEPQLGVIAGPKLELYDVRDLK